MEEDKRRQSLEDSEVRTDIAILKEKLRVLQEQIALLQTQIADLSLMKHNQDQLDFKLQNVERIANGLQEESDEIQDNHSRIVEQIAFLVLGALISYFFSKF